jgi:hypothetical protein
MAAKKIKQLLSKKVETGLSIGFASYSILSSKTRDKVFAHFGGSLFFVNEMTSGTGLTKFVGLSDKGRTVFLGFCETLKTYVLRFLGDDATKTLQNFAEKFLFDANNEGFLQDIRLTSLEGLMICMPGTFSTPEDYMNAIEKIRQVQQKTIPKVEINQGTLYIGGKTGNNSIRVTAYKSQTGGIESLCLYVKAKGSVAEKIGNLFIANNQSRFIDVVAFHLVTTLNSISSTALLELFKQDLVKLYAVGSILLQQNTEKQTLTSVGVYVARSLKGVSNKLFSSSNSVETQELVIQWLTLLVVNQKFIKKGDTFVSSLKTIFDGKTAVPTQDDKPVVQKPRSRTGSRAAKAAVDVADSGSSGAGS